MREAIGSTFLFKIMIVFIFFFSAFLAIAINYSQAFRIKNQVINYIEQYEGMNDSSEEEIVNYINDVGYFRTPACDCDSGGAGNNYSCGDTNDDRNGAKIRLDSGNETNGLCVRKLENGNGDVYYRVTTFVSFDLPIIGEFVTFPVKGETKAITNDR